MAEKIKIAFYSLLSSGHINVCASLATAILNTNENVDIYFVTDEEWKNKISKYDSRFKFSVFTYDTKKAENRITDQVDNFKKLLQLPAYEGSKLLMNSFIRDPSLVEIDRKTAEELDKIKPDFLLCDQIFHLSAMQKFNYGFIVSANPLVLDIDDRYPLMSSDHFMNETEKIKELRIQFKEAYEENSKILNGYLKDNGYELSKDLCVYKPFSKHFSVYSYPAELDYYSQEIKEKFNLWQIDGPLFRERIPKPFELPDGFKDLPGKIIYVSLGSLFSAFSDQLQRMINILDKVPNAKFIISKGPNGDKLQFPSNKFIGDNFVDQLAILQIADLAIVHGGNNTFTECFYFAVPQIIIPVTGDQPNNMARLIETDYGYGLNFKFTEDELLKTVDIALKNEELKIKLKKSSERIQKEERIHQVASKIVNYVDNLKK